MGDNPEHKRNFYEIVKAAMATLKTYGADTNLGENGVVLRARAFHMVLKDYPYWAIESAFLEHMKTKPEFPAPADIAILVQQNRQFITHRKNLAQLQKRIDQINAIPEPLSDAELAEREKRTQRAWQELKAIHKEDKPLLENKPLDQVEGANLPPDNSPPQKEEENGKQENIGTDYNNSGDTISGGGFGKSGFKSLGGALLGACEGLEQTIGGGELFDSELEGGTSRQAGGEELRERHSNEKPCGVNGDSSTTSSN